MHIQEAKEEIKRTLRIYTQKKPDGSYLIPTERQRPVLLIGPPGIGKTAIMKQIAAETGVGLVSYTMTHHTRQSAIGLPMVHQRTFGDSTVSITEYTMSEIVASLHIYMEETGIREGILFLDEINCVSETLTPVILQLLQNKTFGNCPLPPGWVIVAAGNPPEYNRSVRELDMVTLDRVKHMEIEADLAVWLKYAAVNRIHPAIRSYLQSCPEDFYQIQNTAGGQLFVTARGWEDLSTILAAYELYGEEVSDHLFLQYLQHDDIAHSFGLFYRLFRKICVETDDSLTISEIKPLGDIPSMFCAKLRPAEYLALSSIILAQIQHSADTYLQGSEQLARIHSLALSLRQASDPCEIIKKQRSALQIRAEHGAISTEERLKEETALGELEAFINHVPFGECPVELWETDYQRRQHELDHTLQLLQSQIDLAYQTLQDPSIPHVCRIYFTADMTNDDSIARLMGICPVDSYLAACRELFPLA